MYGGGGFMKRERFLFLVAAVCGGGALALELTASRLLAPVFGTSMIVWSAIIGSTLVDLTAGYWFGGWLADRRPEEGLLYRLMTVAAVLTGIIPFLAHPILQWGWRATNRLAVGGVVGAFFVLLLLFALPVALLGAVSPFVLRLVIPAVTSAGRTAGKLSAVATLGSLVGALLPALVLVPLFGTRHTFLVVALVVIALAVWGFLRLSRQKAAALSATLGLLLALGYLPLRHIPIIAYEKAIYETESVYNYIQVVERGRGSGKGVFLRLNESKNDHSVYRPNRTFTYQVWDYAAITPMLTPDFDPVEHPISRVALIGGAAGTMARILTRVYGPVPIDHVEIDPKVIEVARKYFGLTEKNIHVHNEDGRAFLARSHERYDVVLVDAYQIPYIPFHLTTTE
ncbi:MAG: spermine synthase, partial [Deltaproteobacteria bacterium]